MVEQKNTFYELSRNFWDWCYENPERINPNHGALYFFIIEQCNRMGWKEKFGFPSQVAKDAVGIRSHNTYIKTLRDLIEFGFIKMIQESKNQYSANIIALSKNFKAHSKALDKASIRHASKQRVGSIQSNLQSTDNIIKPITKKQSNKETNIPELGEFMSHAKVSCEKAKMDFDSLEFSIESKYNSWVDDNWLDGHGKKIKNWKSKFNNTLPFLKPINGTSKNSTGSDPRDRKIGKQTVGEIEKFYRDAGVTKS